MLEKLTPREKKLAAAVGVLLPITLLFMGVFWFLGKYNDNSNQILSLDSQIEAEEDRMMAAAKAERRRTYFNNLSLSTEINNATQVYMTWLELLGEDVGLNMTMAKPSDASPLKFGRQEVGRRKTFTVIAKGNLEQLTNFLARFYEVDTLHRINKLRIVPQNEAVGSEKKIRTGELSINIQIEVLALNTADETREFTLQYRKLARSTEDYHNAILRRNIFGPANNTPTLAVRDSRSNDSGEEVTLKFTGKDADANDMLTFELIDPPFEGIKLEHESGKRSASLIIPGQLAGEYDLKLKVVDNGIPTKESIEDVKITFKDVVVKTSTPKTPDPPYKHASQTRVTGISQGRDGKWLAWITPRLTKDNYRLKEGESFTMDEQEWIVETIKPTEVVLRVGDKLYVGRPNPRERGVLKEIANPDHKVIETETTDDKDVDEIETPQDDADALEN